MRLNSIAALALGTVLFIAPQAFAMGGGGHSGGGGGTFNFSGSVDNTHYTGSGTYNGNGSGGTFSGNYTVGAAEPLSAFALGLGLLGARYLRRRNG